MIIKEHQLEKFIGDNNQLLNILIYGPNEGLVKEQIEKIIQNYLSSGDYEQVNISGKDLDNDPQTLDDVIRTVSMFHKGKIVIAAAEKNKQIKRSLTMHELRYSSTVSHLLHLYQDIPGRPQPAKHFPRRRLTNFRISFR